MQPGNATLFLCLHNVGKCAMIKANALGIYAYDAYLIRCTLKYRAPLISLDRNLVHAAKEMRVKVIEVGK